jgi:DNA-directed RNA polymerase
VARRPHGTSGGDKAKEEAAGIKSRAARIILDQGFGRSDAKRNMMTYFYGSGKFGMRDQHMVATMRPLADPRRT